MQPDKKRQMHMAHVFAQTVVPERRAFRPRRPIAAAFDYAWVAEAHRHKGDPVGIVEGRFVDPHPLAQPRSARIFPWDPGFMHAPARRLPDDEHAGERPQLDDRARAERQGGLADRAGPNVAQEV